MNNWTLALVFAVAVGAFLWMQGGQPDDAGIPPVQKTLSDKPAMNSRFPEVSIDPVVSVPSQTLGKNPADVMVSTKPADDNMVITEPVDHPDNVVVIALPGDHPAKDMVIELPGDHPAADIIITKPDKRSIDGTIIKKIDDNPQSSSVGINK